MIMISIEHIVLTITTSTLFLNKNPFGSIIDILCLMESDIVKGIYPVLE